ncbi:MAG: hypothetical protein J5938_02630 [Clostridia bacterium]|nr:hypothetical protein [Clostridia bacterium]
MDDRKKKKRRSNCDDCVHFEYDPDWQETVCNVPLDEDEYERYLSGNHADCTYYQPYDEYKSVRKQN